MSGRPMHRQVLLLATAQALFQTSSVLVMTIGALAGANIAPSAQLATAPIAAMLLGTALTTAPASLVMGRIGRRRGFVTGALFGSAGGLLAALGVWAGSLVLLSLGTLLVGAYQGFAQFYRFAAGELADDAFRPRAISFVLAGGIVAALLGPTLARVGGPLLRPDYVGSFLLLTTISLLAAGVLTGLKMPPMVPATLHGPARPLLQIVRQPAYLVALFGAASGYGVMVLAMTATPLAMVHHQHSLAATSTVIQLHVLGMFLPSFFTGALIARFGVGPIMFTGIAMLAGHVGLSLSGTALPSFAGALIFLGIGWNFLYLGGTTLLTTTYRPAERSRAQAANEMIIILVGLGCSLGAGALLQVLGWQALNMLLIPWLAAAAGALMWIGTRRKGPGPTAAALH